MLMAALRFSSAQTFPASWNPSPATKKKCQVHCTNINLIDDCSFERTFLLPSLVVFEGIFFALVLVELHVQLEAVVPLQRIFGNAHVHLHRDLLQRSSDHAAKEEAALVDEKRKSVQWVFFLSLSSLFALVSIQCNVTFLRKEGRGGEEKKIAFGWDGTASNLWGRKRERE